MGNSRCLCLRPDELQAADAHALIRGWSEIAKMCGFLAPETMQVEVSVSAKRMIDQFEAMSDDELLVIAECTLAHH